MSWPRNWERGLFLSRSQVRIQHKFTGTDMASHKDCYWPHFGPCWLCFCTNTLTGILLLERELHAQHHLQLEVVLPAYTWKHTGGQFVEASARLCPSCAQDRVTCGTKGQSASCTSQQRGYHSSLAPRDTGSPDVQSRALSHWTRLPWIIDQSSLHIPYTHPLRGRLCSFPSAI